MDWTLEYFENDGTRKVRDFRTDTAALRWARTRALAGKILDYSLPTEHV